MKRVRQRCFGASADFFWDHLTAFLSVVSSVRILPSRLFGRSEFGAGRGPAASGRYRLGRSQKCVGADKGCLPGKRKPALHMQGRLSFSGQATLVRPYTFLRPAKPVSAGSCRAPASSEFRTSKQTRRQDPDRRHDGKKRRQVVPKEIGRCPETALPNSFQALCIP